MDSMTLLDLAQQCQQATPEQTRELLNEAYTAIFGKSAQWDAVYSFRETGALQRGADFKALLDINTQEAFLGAAMMLKRADDAFSVDTLDGYPDAVVGNSKRALIQADYRRAATPTLALLSAICLAEAGKHG